MIKSHSYKPIAECVGLEATTRPSSLRRRKFTLGQRLIVVYFNSFTASRTRFSSFKMCSGIDPDSIPVHSKCLVASIQTASNDNAPIIAPRGHTVSMGEYVSQGIPDPCSQTPQQGSLYISSQFPHFQSEIEGSGVHGRVLEFLVVI